MTYIKKQTVKTKPAPVLSFAIYSVMHVIHSVGTQDYYRVKFTNIKPADQVPEYFIQIYESKDTGEFKELTTNYYRTLADYQTAVKCLELSLNDPRYKRSYK